MCVLGCFPCPFLGVGVGSGYRMGWRGHPYFTILNYETIRHIENYRNKYNTRLCYYTTTFCHICFLLVPFLKGKSARLKLNPVSSLFPLSSPVSFISFQCLFLYFYYICAFINSIYYYFLYSSTFY